MIEVRNNIVQRGLHEPGDEGIESNARVAAAE